MTDSVLTSLSVGTSPTARSKLKYDQFISELTNEETEIATKQLIDKSFINVFPKVERSYADPPIPDQKYVLISFIPAKGASPNDKGIYGMAKVRGVYPTIEQCDERSDFIIKKKDSIHKIQYAHVGMPFPLTLDSKYASETTEIDIKKDITTNMSHSIKESRDNDQKIMKEMQEKEKKLLEDSKKAKEAETKNEIIRDNYEDYITLRVKKAQLTWTYKEHQKKMEEIKNIIIKARKEISDVEEANPNYKDEYFEKYKQARVDAGLKADSDQLQNSFMKYLVEDVDLGF